MSRLWLVELSLAYGNDGAVRRAVQVKRRIATDTEPVGEVRNFVGAMVLTGSDCGIFVTTASRFSAVAQSVPGSAKEAKFKLQLELIDGERLFEMLRATSSTMTAQFPPRVEPDQEWRGPDGRTILARELFNGDIRDWA
ncbi:restriction endonuclease [Rhizobium leguminosarum]|uniref:restriction endonuclease n=1 Tax=Rhizobium leguminosarum TaxID=384 RepID=UPI001C93791B|nr:restriction endonuclease [Rhizobium leguminosarum]MBY5700411.1 restriction endonuclease [Rhizobium leguminosarum]